ncbi:ABC transporter ATP-binding protein [Cerasicoccus fimbriatus]|uniref:ABC transporter ATP-binding protein n=1 Tax=Cerasicoccus fimbriatus TaxID=3014554 RepID=UPI0022B2C1B3|nr:ABC transporter ATP-binding protein [Cerasicoccus sp. TK19100]
MTTEPQLRIENVSKRYANGNAVLENFSIDIDNEDFIAFIGPRGCGKSTILRLIAGLTPLTAGKISFAGGEKDPHRASFIFQEPALLPWRSVGSNVGLPLRLKGVSPDLVQERVKDVLKVWEINHVSERFPLQLSAGMKIRTALARGLVTQPRCLLLDEPFAAVDAITRNKLSVDLMKVRQKHHFSACLVTHSTAEAVFLANRVVVLAANPGRIAEVIDVPELYPRKLAWRETDAFQESVNQVRNALNRVQEDAKKA